MTCFYVALLALRHFAVTQEFGCFRSDADIRRRIAARAIDQVVRRS
jgi:hypothetical protein